MRNITTLTQNHLIHFAKISEIFSNLGMEVLTFEGDFEDNENTFGKYNVYASHNSEDAKMYKIDLYGECDPEEGRYYL